MSGHFSVSGGVNSVVCNGFPPQQGTSERDEKVTLIAGEVFEDLFPRLDSDAASGAVETIYVKTPTTYQAPQSRSESMEELSLSPRKEEAADGKNMKPQAMRPPKWHGAGKGFAKAEDLTFRRRGESSAFRPYAIKIPTVLVNEVEARCAVEAVVAVVRARAMRRPFVDNEFWNKIVKESMPIWIEIYCEQASNPRHAKEMVENFVMHSWRFLMHSGYLNNSASECARLAHGQCLATMAAGNARPRALDERSKAITDEELECDRATHQGATVREASGLRTPAAAGAGGFVDESFKVESRRPCLEESDSESDFDSPVNATFNRFARTPVSKDEATRVVLEIVEDIGDNIVDEGVRNHWNELIKQLLPARIGIYLMDHDASGSNEAKREAEESLMVTFNAAVVYARLDEKMSLS